MVGACYVCPWTRDAALPVVEGNAICVFQIATKNVQRAADGEVDAATAGLLHCFKVGQ